MIEIEFLLVLILVALCVIASRLKKGNELAEKSQQHLSALRTKPRPNWMKTEPELELKPEDIEQPQRETLS